MKYSSALGTIMTDVVVGRGGVLVFFCGIKGEGVRDLIGVDYWHV